MRDSALAGGMVYFKNLMCASYAREYSSFSSADIPDTVPHKCDSLGLPGFLRTCLVVRHHHHRIRSPIGAVACVPASTVWTMCGLLCDQCSVTCRLRRHPKLFSVLCVLGNRWKRRRSGNTQSNRTNKTQSIWDKSAASLSPIVKHSPSGIYKLRLSPQL